MIISHKYRYIFIKTRKTAGTSIEIALSKYAGPDDILTPIIAEDEFTRTSLGYRGPQNYHISLRQYSIHEALRSIYTGRRLAFYNHCSADFVQRHVDSGIWDSYFKFSFERNPWDKLVSWYFWLCKTEPRPTVTEFARSDQARLITNFPLYTINSKIVVDKVFLFERLEEAMSEISERVGLPEVPSLPRSKSEYRQDKRSYKDILSQVDRDTIQKIHSNEIDCFKYEW